MSVPVRLSAMGTGEETSVILLDFASGALGTVNEASAMTEASGLLSDPDRVERWSLARVRRRER